MQSISINKIVYYSGTFDPPHNGHLHALLTAMLAVNAERAVVWADEKENSYKPDRLPWEIRTDMLKKMFEPFSAVYIGERWTDVRRTLENAYIVFLIGSDVWERYSQKTPNKTHKEILISCRDDASPINISYPIPVKVIYPLITNCSSTKVRQAFCNLNRVEETTPLIDHSLPKRVQTVIRERLLYINSSLRQQILRERMLVNLCGSKEWKDSTIQLISNHSGVSGDYVYRVYCKGSVFFGKAFSTHRKAFPQGRLTSEAEASKWIREAEFGFATAPNMLKIHFDKDYCWGFSISEFCTARDLGKFSDINEMKRAFFLAGKGLRELHSKIQIQRPHFPVPLDNYDNKALNCAKFCSDITDNEYYLLQDVMRKAKQKFHLSWGVETWTHNDANLGNFMIDLTENKVTVVDLSTFSIGFPAKDYHQVLSGLHYKQLECAMPEEIITLANRKFREGYDNQGFITKEAGRYFKLYWKIRTICSYFKSNKPHLKMRAHYLIKSLISKYYKPDN